MKPEELAKHFKQAAIEDTIELNPLAVAESQEFHRRPLNPAVEKDRKDYRQRALDIVSIKKLPFQSTLNSMYELFKRWIKVTCPYCGGETEVFQGSGGSIHTTAYRCKACKAEMGLTVQENGFFAYPEKTN